MASVRDVLAGHQVPDEGLTGELLDTAWDQLSGEHIEHLLNHLNIWFTPSPSIRPHILPLINHLFLVHPTHAGLLPASALFRSLVLSLCLDPAPGLLDLGLRLLAVTIPQAVVEYSNRIEWLLAVLARAVERADRGEAHFGGIHSHNDNGVDDSSNLEQPSSLTSGDGSSTTSTTTASASVSPDRPLTNYLTLPSSLTRNLQPASRLEWKTYTEPVAARAENTASGEAYTRDVEFKSSPSRDDEHDGFAQYRQLRHGEHHHHHHHHHRHRHSSHSHPQPSVTPPAAVLPTTLSDYLALLYTAYPINVIWFVRDPAAYLAQKGMECIYHVPAQGEPETPNLDDSAAANEREWMRVWRGGELARLIMPYMRSLLFNPSILAATSPKVELETIQTRFAKTEATRVVGLAGSLSSGSEMAAAAAVSATTTGTTAAASGTPSGTLKSTGVSGLSHLFASGTTTPVPPRNQSSNTDDQGSLAAIPSRTWGNSGMIGPTTMSIAIRPNEHGPSGQTATGTTAATTTPATATTTAATNPTTATPHLPVGGTAGTETKQIAHLSRQLAHMGLELDYQKRLAKAYLDHVNRLYHASLSVRSGEAEQQNLFNRIKDQDRLLDRIRRDFQSNKDELARMRKASSESKAGMSAKLLAFKNLKKQLLHDQGKVNDEMIDRDHLIDHLKGELSKEKEKNFKVTNRLREAEPRIARINDYQAQIDAFVENQTAWQGDIERLARQSQELITANSVVVQLEAYVKTVNAQWEACKSECEDVRRELEVAMHDIDVLKSQVRRAEGVAAHPTEKGPLEAMTREMSGWKSKYDRAQERINELESNVLDLEVDREELDYLRQGKSEARESILA